MKANEIIENARIGAGLEKLEIASRIGLSIHEYDDIEAYENEVFDAVPLRTVIALCRELCLDPFSLFGLSRLNLKTSDDVEGRPFNSLIRDCRLSKNFSITKLASEMDYYEDEVLRIEQDQDAIKDWAYSDIAKLCGLLDLPITFLLKAQS